MSKSSAFAVENGTLHLAVDIDLGTVAAVLTFLAIAAAEIGFVIAIGHGLDVDQFAFAI